MIRGIVHNKSPRPESTETERDTHTARSARRKFLSTHSITHPFLLLSFTSVTPSVHLRTCTRLQSAREKSAKREIINIARRLIGRRIQLFLSPSSFFSEVYHLTFLLPLLFFPFFLLSPNRKKKDPMSTIGLYFLREFFISHFNPCSLLLFFPSIPPSSYTHISKQSRNTRDRSSSIVSVLSDLEKLLEDAPFLSLSLSIPLSDFVVDVGGALRGHLLDNVNRMSIISADLLIVWAVVVLTCAQGDDDVTRLRAAMGGALGWGQCAK